jgi:hypothetical protein
MVSLQNEFDDFRSESSHLPFWNNLLWEQESANWDDWIMVDAWYRSRCSELPQQGQALVPGLDMVNHSRKATARYEEHIDSITLSSRSGAIISQGDEVTISYGNSRPAAEMLFSYGFIDQDDASFGSVVLPLDLVHDDPLEEAKLHMYGKLPAVKLTLENNIMSWECRFAYLMSLNEEDGLEFRILQDVSGGRQPKLFWQDEDVTDRVGEFEVLIQGHPMCQIFKLRAITIVLGQVTKQLEKISTATSDGDIENLIEVGLLRRVCVVEAEKLREIETQILMIAADKLELEVGDSPFPAPL